jgi:hypothetical protein
MESEKLTAEFTSGQLVIGICVALFMAVVFFIAGGVVYRFFDRPQLAKTQLGSKTVSASEAAKPAEKKTDDKKVEEKKAEEKKTEGVQTSPRTDVAAKPAGPMEQPLMIREASRVRELPALPPPPASSSEAQVPAAAPTPAPAPGESPGEPTKVAPGAAAPAAPAETTAKPEEPVKAEKAEKTEKPAEKAEKTEKAGEKTKPVETPKPAVAKASSEKVAPTPLGTVPAASVKKAAEKAKAGDAKDAVSSGKGSNGVKGQYGIQLTSLTGPNREKAAQDAVRKLKATCGVDATVITSGKRCRVVIGGYKDYASAVAACAEIRRKTSITDAFVPKQPLGN